ncbi:DUF4174 domain-containing protein [candidate division KSB1 bacterium]|nr:DUF4174 domain-containing protein [candidate division KSB1 bacterium]
MNYFIVSTFIAFIVGFAFSQSGDKDVLKEYRWKNRPILLFAPSKADSTFQQIEKNIKDLRNELDDRHIVLFKLFTDGNSSAGDTLFDQETAAKLYRVYNVNPEVVTLVLIGKDGGEKLRQQNEEIDFQTVFDRIDAMPMRRREMQNRNR